jgi:hypothetical protein
MKKEKLRQNVLPYVEEKEEEREEKCKWGAHSKFIICSTGDKNRLEWILEVGELLTE